VTRKIDKLKDLNKNFGMESDVQMKGSAMRVEDVEMGQISVQTKMGEIP
jgi:hypothetical protein